MLLGLNCRFLFLANVKCASTAIEVVLSSHAEVRLTEPKYGKHLPLFLVQERLGWVFDVTPLNQFFVFGVMRDPADVLVSIYNSHSSDIFREYPTLYTGDIGFDNFLERWTILNAEQVVPQHSRFLTREGEIGANYIASYPKLRQGLDHVASVIDAPALRELPLVNVSPARLTRDQLSPTQLDLIRRRFAEDYRFIERYVDRPIGNEERTIARDAYGVTAPGAFALAAEMERNKHQAVSGNRLYIVPNRA